MSRRFLAKSEETHEETLTGRNFFRLCKSDLLASGFRGQTKERSPFRAVTRTEGLGECLNNGLFLSRGSAIRFEMAREEPGNFGQ